MKPFLLGCRGVPVGLLVGALSACVSKETVVNAVANQSHESAKDAGGAGPSKSTGADDAVTDDAGVVASGAEPPATASDAGSSSSASPAKPSAEDSAGSAGNGAQAPDAAAADDGALADSSDGEPSEGSSEQDTENTQTEPADDAAPSAAATLTTCVSGAVPGRAPALQLTDSSDNKQGLHVVWGDGGYLAAWQAVGAGNKREIAYAGFDAQLEPRFEESKLADVQDASSGVAVAYSTSKQAYVVAYDTENKASIAWVTPSDGMPVGQAAPTELPTVGRPLFVASSDSGVLMVVSMRSEGGCPGVSYLDSRLLNEATEVVTTPQLSPCVFDTLGVFVEPSVGFGVVMQPLTARASLVYVDPDGSRSDSATGLDAEMDVSGGAVVGWDGSKVVMAAARPAGGVNYGRFKTDGVLAGSAANVSAVGTPRSLAVAGGSVGVLVEQDSSVQFFARATDDGASVHPPAVVAAQKGLLDPVLVSDGETFTVFFLAEDTAGDPQVFASEVQCVE